MNAPFDAPVLGQRVNVGAGAKLLGGIRVGDDASIGANSVVLKDVPAGGTAVGVPARLLDTPSAVRNGSAPPPRSAPPAAPNLHGNGGKRG
jgi:serine O-acetyltransferase